MKKLLTKLLKETYTKKALVEQLQLITTDTKANKQFSNGKTLITPDIIDKLPMATVTLAVSLPKEEVARLGRWFRRNIDPQVLLDLRQDPKIIGGCQIIWQGFEGDFSLRKKFKNGG